MPEITIDQGKSGVKGATNQRLDIVVNQPSIEILIGGPYTLNGEAHTYGHAALRTISAGSEKIYDFGRYGEHFGPTGDGVLRVWSNFNTYIKNENKYQRSTTGFLYAATTQQISQIDAYYEGLIARGKPRKALHPNQTEFQLEKDYSGIDNNCTTMTLDGARIALPKIEYNSPSNNQGRGMSSSEMIAARTANYGRWPSRIFMPADVKAMLEQNQVHRPLKVSTYGGPK